ncbi:MAG: hypothetical protein KA257_12785 [Opitutaceae bacterium]|nr:hypothetical protein [Opitutaceae bacterium]MBP9911992.1 hypothetical protein [Opitutaceae bacterium]
MKTREKVELALIGVAFVLVTLAHRHLPARMSVGALLVVGCLGWLVQGGLRDLWLLYLTKTRADSAPQRRFACMCLESSAGFTGVVIGVLLVLTGVGGEVTLGAGAWLTFAAAVMLLGFLVKDYVITWRPLGLRREPDHHTFIFTWR